ncbi:unnamed protein product [Toxocara canis]|uniref:Uncharacterized protein n=1 Tax=Toxocara canis TaxID=6265 RepID=A0A183V8M8_TOXCA|nr:unnamed protein product [Toxocara canis]
MFSRVGSRVGICRDTETRSEEIYLRNGMISRASGLQLSASSAPAVNSLFASLDSSYFYLVLYLHSTDECKTTLGGDERFEEARWNQLFKKGEAVQEIADSSGAVTIEGAKRLGKDERLEARRRQLYE